MPAKPLSLDAILAERLRAHAAKFGIPLDRLATATGLDAQAIHQILDGQVPLIEPGFIAITTALGLKAPDELRQALRALEGAAKAESGKRKAASEVPAAQS